MYKYDAYCKNKLKKKDNSTKKASFGIWLVQRRINAFLQNLNYKL